MLLVPFQVPQAPSVCQSVERTAVKEDDELRSRVCGDGLGFVDAALREPISEVESKPGESFRLRGRD